MLFEIYSFILFLVSNGNVYPTFFFIIYDMIVVTFLNRVSFFHCPLFLFTLHRWLFFPLLVRIFHEGHFNWNIYVVLQLIVQHFLEFGLCNIKKTNYPVWFLIFFTLIFLNSFLFILFFFACACFDVFVIVDFFLAAKNKKSFFQCIILRLFRIYFCCLF